MPEELDLIIEISDDSMSKAITHLEAELLKIRAGKATPGIIDGIVVDYYGNPTPINQVGNISVADARTLTIQPWEKNMLQPIERSIIAANIGLNPQNDGNLIRLFLPPLNRRTPQGTRKKRSERRRTFKSGHQKHSPRCHGADQKAAEEWYE